MSLLSIFELSTMYTSLDISLLVKSSKEDITFLISS